MAGHEWIHGRHTVQTLLERRPEAVLEVLVLEGGDADTTRLAAQAQALGIAVGQQRRAVLDRLAPEAVHQGVLARVRSPQPLDETGLERLLQGAAAPLVLVLDQVQDPRNLGACIRSAAAAGATAVVVPRRRAAGLGPAARKAAAGAAEWFPVAEVTNLARCLRLLQNAGLRCVGAAADAPDELYGAALDGPLALIMGGEGQGLRRLTREHCDDVVRIPMAADCESLNVSVAAALCLFEARRQRAL